MVSRTDSLSSEHEVSHEIAYNEANYQISNSLRNSESDNSVSLTLTSMPGTSIRTMKSINSNIDDVFINDNSTCDKPNFQTESTHPSEQINSKEDQNCIIS